MEEAESGSREESLPQHTVLKVKGCPLRNLSVHNAKEILVNPTEGKSGAPVPLVEPACMALCDSQEITVPGHTENPVCCRKSS